MASEASQRWTIVLALLLLGLTLYLMLGPSWSPTHARLPPEGRRPHDDAHDEDFRRPPSSHRHEPPPSTQREKTEENKEGAPTPPKQDGWVYAERPATEDLQGTYSRCGTLLPPDSMWRTKVRKPGDHHGRLPLVPLAQREELGCLLELFGFKTGAELGVQNGLYSRDMLTRWKSCQSYILVDVWAKQEHYDDVANVDDARQDSIYRTAQANLAAWKNITTFMRMYTHEAARLVADNSLDFIYVDARHDYCGAKQDIHDWWPKLRMGGILAGHDYLSSSEVKQRSGSEFKVCTDGSVVTGSVKAAANEFAFTNNLQMLSTLEQGWPTWYLQKLA